MGEYVGGYGAEVVSVVVNAKEREKGRGARPYDRPWGRTVQSKGQ